MSEKINTHSKLPELMNAQILQHCVDHEFDPSRREIMARIGLKIPTQDIVGKFFAVEAGLAYGQTSESYAKKAVVYDKGLTFAARAVDVDYDCNADVPVDSIVIGFEQPWPLVPEEVLIDDEGKADELKVQALEEAEAHSLVYLRVPVLSIIRGAVKLNEAA